MKRQLQSFIVVIIALACNCAPIDDDLAPFGKRLGGSFSNEVTYNGGVYSFLYKVNDTTVTEYFVDTTKSTIMKGQFEIGVMESTRQNPFYVASGCGPNYFLSPTVYRPFEYINMVTSTDFSHSQTSSNSVALSFSMIFTASAQPLNYTALFTIEGTTLSFEIADPTGRTAGNHTWWGFFIGGTRNTPNPTPHKLPYLPDPIFSFDYSNKRYYGSHYLDRSKSNGIKFTQYYDRNSMSISATHYTTAGVNYAGAIVPLGEVGYVTVSPNIKDVMPSPYFLQETPSYLPDLADRVFLDIWNVDCSPYFDPAIDSVRQWTALTSGLVSLTSIVSDLSSGCGNGVLVYVKHEQDTILSAVLANGDTGVSLNADIDMQQGESLFFHVDANGDMNCDATNWTINIVTADRTYNQQADFSSVQGQNGWSYLQYTHNDLNYTALVYNTTTKNWNGPVQSLYPSISPLSMHPAYPSSSAAGFDCTRWFIEELTWYGMKRLSIVVHSWQRYGYDVKLPSHYPANPDRGGSDAMKKLINSAKALGHRIGLHENYVDMYPDSPLYNASQLALLATGATQNSWFNTATNKQSLLIAGDYCVDIAQTQQPFIAADYAPNAGYEDVDTAVEPGRYITFGRNAKAAHSWKNMVIYKKNLWNSFRVLYQGPLYGEGRDNPNFDSTSYAGHYVPYYAGYVDGVEAQLDGRMGAATMPEFALFINKNTQYNNGLGYVGRYTQAEGFNSRSSPMDTYLSDRYRAQQIAFGHSGWLSFGYRWGRQTLAETLTEYHLSRGYQQRIFTSPAKTVSHYLNGQWLGLSEYVKNGGDLVNNVVKIELEDNTQVVVNNRQTRLWSAWPNTGNELVRTVQFSQDFGYYYYNRATNMLLPMPWSAKDQAFKNGNVYCFVRSNIVADGYQCDGAVVFAPKKQITNLQLTLFLQKVGGTCGDGMTLRVTKGVFDTSSPSQSIASFTSVYDFTFRNSTAYEVNVNGVTSMAANEALVFRLDQQTSPDCDTMSIRIWATADIVSDSITPYLFTVPEANNIVLPPNGFVAWNTDLNYLSYSGKLQDPIIAVDYSRSEFSTFARSRSGVAQTIENINTDGTIAFEPSEDGENYHVYFADLKTGAKDDKIFIESDTQIYGRAVYLNTTAVEITVYATAPTPIPPRVSFFYGGFSDALLDAITHASQVVVKYETTTDAHAVVALNQERLGLNITMTAGHTIVVSVDISTTPIAQPISQPIAEPQAVPIAVPVNEPISEPISVPLAEPMAPPQLEPIAEPISIPIIEPISAPIDTPTSEPQAEPLSEPTTAPQPIDVPSSEPHMEPSTGPISVPQSEPSSVLPSAEPITIPLSAPVSQPISAVPVTPVTSPIDTPVNTPITNSPSSTPSIVSTPSLVPSSSPANTPQRVIVSAASSLGRLMWIFAAIRVIFA